jgi:DNA-binding response OmpR family regulator
MNNEIHGYRPTFTTAPVGEFAQVEGDSCRRPALSESAALVVDDSLPARVQMRGVLPSIVARVDFAATGGQALQLIDTHAYGIIFLDVTLPDEDAYEICGRIKKHPLQQGATVVMLTSSSSSADRVMGVLAGFDNCLVKPVQRGAFSELAAELLRPSAAI